MLKIIRGMFIIPAYLILFIGYMLTADNFDQTFYEWLKHYAYID